jgi:hypothetical protein
LSNRDSGTRQATHFEKKSHLNLRLLRTSQLLWETSSYQVGSANAVLERFSQREAKFRGFQGKGLATSGRFVSAKVEDQYSLRSITAGVEFIGRELLIRAKLLIAKTYSQPHIITVSIFSTDFYNFSGKSKRPAVLASRRV